MSRTPFLYIAWNIGLFARINITVETKPIITR